jgi:hypothetical protein
VLNKVCFSFEDCAVFVFGVRDFDFKDVGGRLFRNIGLPVPKNVVNWPHTICAKYPTREFACGC